MSSMKKKNLVGDNIRNLRLKFGITQEALALKSGLSQGYINQLESGKRRFTQKSLEVIADALEIPLEELFKEEGTRHTSRVSELPVGLKRYTEKPLVKKEFLLLLNELPEHIVEHYLTLLRLERRIWKKDKSKTEKGG